MRIKNKTGIIFPLLQGGVYLLNLDTIIGKEIGKARPSVIIQNDFAYHLLLVEFSSISTHRVRTCLH
jgi:mRNA-degrading endonuclease toxin of MazEF toxin-antitoxin module